MAGSGANTTGLIVVTPYKNFYEGDVTSVVISATDGQMGFMAGHPPLIVSLVPGVSHFIENGVTRYFTVSEGYCEVSNNRVLIVCNAAEFPEDLSPRRACKSYTEARKALDEARRIEDKDAREVLIKESEQAMARAMARRHLIEAHGSDHQKERIKVLVKEYGWIDPF
ncbi:MAG: ATP synthase F1 subunit epsilon [Clostridiales bacterium]|nr:ATP synthase F1 subunit epsilon [Clostridiales bacterium]